MRVRTITQGRSVTKQLLQSKKNFLWASSHRTFHATSPVLESMETILGKPSQRPDCPNFSSGPTTKFPGYDVSKLKTRCLGRSHRSKLGLSLLKKLISKSRTILQVPEDYYLGIVPASDTGAFEGAMWSMLGPCPVDVFHWESFGKGWVTDITQQLKLPDVTVHEARYGQLPDMTKACKDSDTIFTWNGTTSGVRVPNGDWIASDRTGLTFCDATSAVFSMRMPWEKLDITTYSFQKALGGEGAHGIMILSPRAIERLNSYTPTWPMPKLFRFTKKGKFNPDVFNGKVINTPSMLCVEDCLAALQFAENMGGLEGMIKRAEANLLELEKFVDTHDWIDFLAQDKKIRSCTSVCLTLDLPAEKVKEMCALLENEHVAYDIGSYRDAPAGLRIWCGSTVETADVRALTHWLKWAYGQVKA